MKLITRKQALMDVRLAFRLVPSKEMITDFYDDQRVLAFHVNNGGDHTFTVVVPPEAPDPVARDIITPELTGADALVADLILTFQAKKSQWDV